MLLQDKQIIKIKIFVKSCSWPEMRAVLGRPMPGPPWSLWTAAQMVLMDSGELHNRYISFYSFTKTDITYILLLKRHPVLLIDAL